ncbi:cell wall protein [Streptomyces sp. NPDC008159]|uniref:cell wall protein n=1 Tax=Streptomyces sp. NPDC008159 TaxID=3364817 RepID=UPI0036EB33FF
MRLCTCLTLMFAVGAGLGGGPGVAVAAVGAAVGCAGADSEEFPILTRIDGGPATYVAGGGFGTWSVELTNTTDRTCADVHPVIVLVDDGRALKRSQPQLEYFEDAKGTTSRPVAFEETDSDELVGVLDEDGDGFTVPAGGTLTVKVRLSVTSDAAVPNDVVANAAVVQRRGDDSEWVGESNDYRFRITDEDEHEDEDEDGHEHEGESEKRDQDADGRRDGGPSPSAGKSERPAGDRVSAEPVPSPDAGPYPGELAASGTGHVLLPYALGVLALAVGGVLAAGVRRRRR